MPDFDRIAEKVHTKGSVSLAAVMPEFGTTPRDAIENAMRARGVEIDGDAMRPATTQPDFAQAATMAVELHGRPMMADEIIVATGLPDTALPLLTLSRSLEEAGLTLIPGIGWWTERVWAGEDGQLFFRRSRSKQGMLVQKLFMRNGWPLHAAEIERLTSGEIRAAALENRADIFGGITNIGMRMYAPEIEAERFVVPMACGMARDLLYMPPDKPILRTRHFSRFIVALLMGRARWANLKRSTTQKGCPRTACLRIRLTPIGRAMLEQQTGARRATSPDLV